MGLVSGKGGLPPLPSHWVTARYRIVLESLLPAAWSCWVSSRSLVPTQHHHFRQLGGLLGSHAVKTCRHDLTPSSQCQCFARWQSERRGAGCWSRLACASWLASQFNRCWCATASAKLHNAALLSVPGSRYAKAALGAGHRFAPCG